jgi:hypothetical protein
MSDPYEVEYADYVKTFADALNGIVNDGGDLSDNRKALIILEHTDHGDLRELIDLVEDMV